MNLLATDLELANPERSTQNSTSTSTEPAGPVASSVIEQYLRILWRRRFVILGITAGAIVLGLIATLLMTPKYTAEATIEISRESDQVTDFQGVERDVGLADEEFYQTQYGLLRARSLAERVATELGFVDDPEFFELFGAGDPESAAFETTNGRYVARDREVRQRVAGEVLLEHVRINPTRMSRLVSIQFTSPDARLSARVANAWAESFIESNLERKVQSTSYGRDALQRQIAETKERLDESQRQLVAYATEAEIINLPGATEGAPERSIVADNLAVLNSELSRATSDRIQAEARFRLAGSGGASGQALANNAINNLRQRRAELAAEYQELMVRFEPSYPRAQAIQEQIDSLDSAIAREEARVAGSVESEYRQAVQRENELEARVASLKQEFLDQRRRAIQYNLYQQEVDTNQVLYDGLLQRFKEIGVAGGVGVNNVAIVDTANVPTRPSSPQLILNLLFAALGGGLVGVALAFVLEQLDQSIGDPADFQRRLSLSLLGTVPDVGGESPSEQLQDRKSVMVDAYLTIQTSLGFTTESGIPKYFAVTSTRAAEGKSTTSLALATTIARAGRKVILVDGDMRSPSVHELVEVGHENGLSNYLSGENDISGMIVHVDKLGIDAMTAGPVPPNAAELLTGNRLSQLVERLLETYDHVVIDSPPVLGLADAPLIAARMEGVVYVVESHGTRIGHARTAINRLRAANVRLFGGVVSKYDQRTASDSYKYDYGYGYGRNDVTRTA